MKIKLLKLGKEKNFLRSLSISNLFFILVQNVELNQILLHQRNIGQKMSNLNKN
jgi:hypothetical protein